MKIKLKHLIRFLTLVTVLAVLNINFTYGADKIISISASQKADCINIFKKFLPNEADIKYMLDRQKDDFEAIKKIAKQITKRDKKQNKQLYSYTAKYLKRNTARNGKYGISYTPTPDGKGITSIATFGDIELVKKIEIEIFDEADSLNPVMTKAMAYSDQKWDIDIPGNLEGKWYRFKVTSQSTPTKPVFSQYKEPIPEVHYTYDLTALKISLNKRAQFYYPPMLDQRPRAPNVTGKALTIYEVNLSDVKPPDVPKEMWGTAEAFIKSKIMQERIKHFDVVEILPPRSSNIVSPLSSDDVNFPFRKDVLYQNHWGYMGQGHGYSPLYGGVEGITALVDHLHSINKGIYIDHVFQHTANDFKELQWMLKKPYLDDDKITGCGNTLDLTEGTVNFDIIMQIFERDLMTIYFDGSRQDLFGAIPKPTAQILVDLVNQWNKRITGEPHAYMNDFWKWNWNTLRGARLWDPESRLGLRELAKDGGHYQKLLSYISGGHPHSWKEQALDAITTASTHDGTTVNYTMEGNFRGTAHVSAMLMSAQGDVMAGPGLPIAFMHPHLNDSPVDLFNLSHDQKIFADFFHKLVGVRKKYQHFFNQPWIDPNDSNTPISYNIPHDHAIGLHYKASHFEGTENSNDLLVLHNLSGGQTSFQIPKGEWQILVDTDQLKASMDESLYPPANSGNYTVAPHASVWLVRKNN